MFFSFSAYSVAKNGFVLLLDIDFLTIKSIYMSSRKRKAYIRSIVNRDPLSELSPKERAVYQKADKLHMKLFDEEYDYMYDSYADMKSRAAGINPMNEAYQQRVHDKRTQLGVTPLGKSGRPVDNSSMEFCRKEVRANMNGKKTQYTKLVIQFLKA